MFGMQEHLTQGQRAEISKWADSHFRRRDQQLKPEVRKNRAKAAVARRVERAADKLISQALRQTYLRENEKILFSEVELAAGRTVVDQPPPVTSTKTRKSKEQMGALADAGSRAYKRCARCNVAFAKSSLVKHSAKCVPDQASSLAPSAVPAPTAPPASSLPSAAAAPTAPPAAASAPSLPPQLRPDFTSPRPPAVPAPTPQRQRVVSGPRKRAARAAPAAVAAAPILPTNASLVADARQAEVELSAAEQLLEMQAIASMLMW